ncbi:MAG: DUF4244 domain-containing protein [Angustibacter sp.]
MKTARTALTSRWAKVTRTHQDAGMTTAEYAIGTIAACGFAALLVTILRSPAVKDMLLGIIHKALTLGG